MAGKYSVGKSSYGDLRGVEQFVSTARIALQVLSVIADFNEWMRSRGRTGRLSVNEASRSRTRQSFLWINRFILGVVVAPPFSSRHDEVLHGNAIDFGITEADGSNRALNSADEFAKLHELVEARGGTWTGVNFGEPWHHEMATRAETLPPYPHVTPSSAAIAHTTTPKPAKKSRKDNEMSFILQAPPTKGASKVSVLIEPGTATHLNSERFQFWKNLKDADGNVLYPIVQGNERSYALALEHRNLITK